MGDRFLRRRRERPLQQSVLAWRYLPWRVAAILMLMIVAGTGCKEQPSRIAKMSKSNSLPTLELPKPRLQSERSLEQTLASRRSIREFSNEPVTDAEVSQLLWAAQGVTDSAGLRAAPSAGALYPLETYVVRSSGLFQFDTTRHLLTQRSDRDLRQAIHGAALAQDALIEAPAVFVITAVYARTRAKYGDRAERYVHMEAGHAAQNLLLQAVALDLGGVPIGAFNDSQLRQTLGLSDDEAPLYLIPVGHPR